MKEDKKQQALNELSQRFAPPFQQITQILQPFAKAMERIKNNLPPQPQLFLTLGKLIGHIGASLYAAKIEAEKEFDELTLDYGLKIPEFVEQYEQRRAGGRATGEQRTKAHNVMRDKVIAKWHELKTTPERNRIGTIANTTGFPSKSTVRRILREAGLIK
jgi:hypothetical protein